MVHTPNIQAGSVSGGLPGAPATPLMMESEVVADLVNLDMDNRLLSLKGLVSVASTLFSIVL